MFSPRLAMPRPARAFTLIELLASMGVLALLMTAVLQMINSAMVVTNGSTKRLDADSQVRMVFDRMAVDFSQIVKRPDVDYYFQKNGTGSSGTAQDDQMAFYSETTGYFPDSTNGPYSKSNAALVGYRIYPNSVTSDSSSPPIARRLERLSKALFWNGVDTAPSSGSDPLRAMTFLPQTMLTTWPGIIAADTAPTVDSSGAVTNADPYYQTIGESIFRMEISYLVGNSITPARLSATPYILSSGTTPPTTPPLPYNAMRDVVAVVVTLATLDDTSRQIVTPAELDVAAGILDDVTNNSGDMPVVTNGSALPSPLPTSPAVRWQKHLVNLNHQNDLASTVTAGALPPRAAQQVRIYERYFYLGNAH